MKPELSQPTLGLLRRILEGMEEEQELLTPYEKKKFWKDALFDFGFPPKVIDIAATYDFRWGDIIRDLFSRKFGEQNLAFAYSLPGYASEETLRRLLALALEHNKGTHFADKLREALASDGFDFKPSTAVDSFVPAELASIPGKSALVSDIQNKIDAGELIAVLYMDLDGFKSVNDTLGHAEGDKCLISIARTMSAAMLGKGRLYRPGGDEFVSVLHNFTRDEAASTAERIRAAVDDENPGGALKVTVSIGVTGSEMAKTTDAETLIILADKAMYAAKKMKNRTVVA